MNTQTPEQIQSKPFFYKPFFIPPKADVFAERAIRFDELAQQQNDAWGDYLRILAELSRTQDWVLQQHQAVLPERAGETRLPDSLGEHIPPIFTACLRSILDKMHDKVSDTVQATLHNLRELPDAQLEQLARQLLRHEDFENKPYYAIWLSAGLQCAWTAWAIQLRDEDVPSVEERSVCPCCAGEAVASVVLNGGDWHGLRYLHCGMCNSRWNALRAKCTFCGDQSAIALQQVDGAQQGALSGARAECCGKCGSYRKLFLLEKQQYADPIADDLATLALDILLGSEGVQRGGHNPFLLTE